MALTEALLAEAASRKRPYIVDKAIEAMRNGMKVLVLCSRKNEVEHTAKVIQGRMRGGLLESYHGSSEGDPSEIKKRYMEYKAEAGGWGACLIGTYQYWGEGHNLQDTDLLIMSQLPVTPYWVEQSEGRVVRPRKEGDLHRPVSILYVVCLGTIETRYREILLDKLPLQGSIANSAILRSFNKDFKLRLSGNLIDRLRRMTADSAYKDEESKKGGSGDE